MLDLRPGPLRDAADDELRGLRHRRDRGRVRRPRRTGSRVGRGEEEREDQGEDGHPDRYVELQAQNDAGEYHRGHGPRQPHPRGHLLVRQRRGPARRQVRSRQQALFFSR